MNELFIQAKTLQNLLISRATGGQENNIEYTRLRQTVLANTALDAYVPQFIKTCRNLDQFWQFIKYKFGSYAERRDYIWSEFFSLLEVLERGGLAPSDEFVTNGIKKIDSAHVQTAWSKALDRRANDPEGAITSARTLI